MLDNQWKTGRPLAVGITTLKLPPDNPSDQRGRPGSDLATQARPVGGRQVGSGQRRRSQYLAVMT